MNCYVYTIQKCLSKFGKLVHEKFRSVLILRWNVFFSFNILSENYGNIFEWAIIFQGQTREKDKILERKIEVEVEYKITHRSLHRFPQCEFNELSSTKYQALLA